MKNRILLVCGLALFAGLAATSLRVIRGQAPGRAGKVPTGAVAAHLVGRLAGNQNEFELIGYAAFVEGLGVPLFTGATGERTARVSFRTERFGLSVIPNGEAFHVTRLVSGSGAAPVVNVYFNPAPARDFARPDTFSDGQLIGVLRPHSTQGILVPGQMFRLAGSLEVESLAPATIDNQSVSLGGLLDAATISFAGVPPTRAEFLAASAVSVPFSATVIAADGASRAQLAVLPPRARR